MHFLPHSTNTQTTQEKQAGTQPGRHRTETHSNTQGAWRHAPSPSGDLHFGNLRTAQSSSLSAPSTNRPSFRRAAATDQPRSTPAPAPQAGGGAASVGGFGSAGGGLGRGGYLPAGSRGHL